MKIFLAISISLHVLCFLLVSILFPDVKTHLLRPLNIEVLLLPFPVIAEERPVARSTAPPRPNTPIKEEETVALERLKEEKPSFSRKSPEDESRPLEIVSRMSLPPEAKPSQPEREEEKTENAEALSTPIVFSFNPGTKTQADESTVVTTTGSLEGDPVSGSFPPPSGESKGNLLPAAGFPEGQHTVAKLGHSSGGEIITLRPRYSENPKPLYPTEARNRGYEGEVLLKVEVLPNGRVGQIELKRSSGHAILDKSALTAVKQWKFQPAKRGENPIPHWVNIPIKFQLQ